MNQDVESIPYQLSESPIKSGIVLGNAFQDYHDKYPNTTIIILIQTDGKKEKSRSYVMRKKTEEGETEDTILTISEVERICYEMGEWYFPQVEREIMVLPYLCDLEPQEVSTYYEKGIPAGCLTAVLSIAECVPNITREYSECSSLVCVVRAIYPYLLAGVGILAVFYILAKKYGREEFHGKL